MQKSLRTKIFLLALFLGLFIVLTPIPVAAEWSLSIYGPSGYIFIAGGTVTIGAAVVIGCLYIWGEGRIAHGQDPPPANSLAINPEDTPEPERNLDLKLDLLSFRF